LKIEVEKKDLDDMYGVAKDFVGELYDVAGEMYDFEEEVLQNM